jgi:hypothetical protein
LLKVKSEFMQKKLYSLYSRIKMGPILEKYWKSVLLFRHRNYVLKFIDNSVEVDE